MHRVKQNFTIIYLQNLVIEGKSSNSESRDHHGGGVGVEDLADDVFVCLP